MSNSGPPSSVVWGAQGLDLLPPADPFSCQSRNLHKGQFIQSPLRETLYSHRWTRGEQRMPIDCMPVGRHMKNFFTWTSKTVVLFGGFAVRYWSTTTKSHQNLWATFTPEEPGSCSSHHFHQARTTIKIKLQRIKLKQSNLQWQISTMKNLFLTQWIYLMELKFWYKSSKFCSDQDHYASQRIMPQ